MRHCLLAAVALCASTLAAHADTFTLTYGSTSLNFSLPSSPTPTLFVTGEGFEMGNVSATQGSMSEMIDIAFYDANGSYKKGGIGYVDVLGHTDYFFSGPQLYTGPDSAPTFLPGDYKLSGATLDITGSAATPEPSSLLLLGTGILGVTGLIRRRLA